MGQRERKIERYLAEQLKEFFPNSLYEKWGTHGNPDRIVFIKNKCYFIEVKTMDGSEQTNQTRQIEKIRKTGNNVYTLRGHIGVNWFIKMLRRKLDETIVYF